MKTLEELFEKVHKVYPHRLALLKENQLIISIHGEGVDNDRSTQKKFLYPLNTPMREEYQLLAATELATETLGLLEILINLYLEEIQSLNKKEILQHIAIGNWKEELLNHQNTNFLKGMATYQLIWIQGSLLEEEVELIEMLEECFKEDADITVVSMDEGAFLLVEGNRTKEEMIGTARVIRDMVNAELFIDVYISISNKFTQLKNLQKVLQQAKTTMAIGKTVALKSHIYLEEELKLEKTIFSIPMQERVNLYAEIYENRGLDELEDEAQLTIETFLQNNLNLGETSKKLFIHRNTLAYRLDRVSKLTSLDLRKFEDAMFYKVAMLLKKSIE